MFPLLDLKSTYRILSFALLYTFELRLLVSVMATQVQQTFTPGPAAAKYNSAHPICALGPEEISYTSDLIRSLWPEKTDLRFKTITLEEPPKAQLLPYFKAEHDGKELPHIDRKSFTSYYIRNTVSSPM